MQSRHNQWILCLEPNPQARVRLVCFPYSGAGAYAFRTWTTRVPPQVEVCAIQLPGREGRFREPLLTQIEKVVEPLNEALASNYLGKPFVFFGHSLGALIAFELARSIRQTHQLQPVHLFVSARPAPQTRLRESPLYCLPDSEFMYALRRMNGTSEKVLGNDELMQVLRSILRADFEMNETYRYTPAVPLACSTSAFRGAQDENTTYEDLAAWSEQTTSSFTLRTFPGDHFFIRHNETLFWQAFAFDLRQVLMRLG